MHKTSTIGSKFAAVKKYIFLVAFLLNCLASLAQPFKIKGKVIDKLTSEPMMFVNVYVAGTTLGTPTDENGVYELSIDQYYDSIEVSNMGYTTQRKSVAKIAVQIINFEMLVASQEIAQVTINPGPDHADIMMRKVIDSKQKNNPERYESYQYETYNKMEIDLDDIGKKYLDNKLMKPFHIIFDNMDSTSNETPFLPLFMTESLSNFYYRKNPKKSKEVILGTKISGIKNESVNQFLGSMYQNFNIYDNWLPILGKSFVSPISDAGFLYYKYYLMDTAVYKTDTIYKILFKPKRKQENTFYGECWIVNKQWKLQQVSMNIDKESNINFVNKLAVFQEFEAVNDTAMFLVKDKLIVVFAATKKDSPGLIGRKTSSYKKIILNNPNIDWLLKGYDDIVVHDDADKHDERYWQSVRHDSLSKNEKAIYTMVDSLKAMPMFKTYVDYITLIASGYKQFGKVELGPYFNVYSNNFVEGHRLRVGFRTSNKFNTRLEFGSFVAYGLKDKNVKYGGHFIYVIDKQPRREIKINYLNDIDVSNTSTTDFGQDNLMSGLYRRPIAQKLLHIHSFEASYFHELRFGYSNKFTFVRKNITPYFDFVYYEGNFPFLEEQTAQIQTAEVKLSAHFAYKEKFLSSNIYRTSLGSKYPSLDIEYTIGIPYVLGSQFYYQKLQLNIYDWFKLPPIGWSEYTLHTSKTFKSLPLLLLDVLPGNETYFYNNFSFNLMNRYEFVTDQNIYIMWNHHFEGLLLNKIPLLQKLKLRWLVSGKAAWGSMTAENIRTNSSRKNFLKYYIPYKIPYSEASVGVENIFKVVRIDAIWRLSYLQNPDISKFGVRAGLQLNF